MVDRREAFIARRNYLGYTQESLAHKLCVALATVSGWERGRRNPSSRHRKPLAELLQVSMAELDRLLNLDDGPEVTRHEVASWISHYDSLVQAAGRTQQVETVAIPALFQTRSYAGHIEQLGYNRPTRNAITSRVEVRLARQAVLWREPAPLEVSSLIDELVLMNPVGGPEVMVEQLDHLLELAQQWNIDLRVIPADGRAICCRGGLELLTKPDETMPFMAVTVDVDGPRYEERPELTSRFVEIFEHFDRVALSPTDSIGRIRAIKERYL